MKMNTTQCRCGGTMVIARGSETRKMLLCKKCGNYYYKLQGIRCIRDKMPRSLGAADAILGGSQRFELAPRVRKMLSKQTLDFLDKTFGVKNG